MVRIRKRSSLVSGLTVDKVTVRHNEATSRGGSEVSEKPTTKADNYYDIASENSILRSDEKVKKKMFTFEHLYRREFQQKPHALLLFVRYSQIILRKLVELPSCTA